MANSFKRQTSRSIGTAPVRIGAYTVAASTTATIIGLSVANVTTSPVAVDVYHSDGTNITYLVKGAPLPVGSALSIVGGDQKVVLTTGDGIFAVSNAINSIDSVMSLLEVS